MRISPRGNRVGEGDKVNKTMSENSVNEIEICRVVFGDFSSSASKSVSNVVEWDAGVTRNPFNVNVSISFTLVVANALPEELYNLFIINTCTVIVSERIVHELAVSVNVNVFVVAISHAEFDANANRD